MSVSSNQARLMTLTARQHDLELRAQEMSAQKMIWTMQTQGVATTYSKELSRISAEDWTDEAKSEAYDKALNTYTLAMISLSSKEKLLDLELTQVNTEHSAVKTEYDAVKSLIGDNVDKSFNVFG